MLHKSKKLSGFLGETKPATFAYTDVREERRRVSTTKSPTRLTYAVSLLLTQLVFTLKGCRKITGVIARRRSRRSNPV
ncbi:hypothetical protein [Candidatus Tisiphia endosymbiont of Oplodontha viridula]|uniref:hypothetical protein n=1 Tax=Candidatus Tisiphia endosymbiont of Oplodontha viridula TaxID=3077925 RepID=UPI0035C930AF